MLLMLAVTAWSIPTTLGCDFACDRYQYCDESNNSCRNCSELCAKDEYTCYHKCQAFTKRISTLESSIAIFKILLCVVVLLFGFLLVGLCVRYRNAIRECCRWRPQSKKGPPAPVGYTHENPNTKSPKAMPKNGANVTKPASTTVSIYPETEADNSVQTGTTSISHRYPAEDSTESYSYDNAACNVTPTSNNPMPKY
uniref:Protein grindelwald n=1 Tax=Anopheles christyi TaxID=43041 RepID=A0A182K0V5_9DIPT